METGAQRRSEIDTVIIDALSAVAPEADLGALDPTVPFRDQIEIDSVDFLNFVLGIERRLGIRVPELDYPQFSTLDGCRAYLARAAAN